MSNKLFSVLLLVSMVVGSASVLSASAPKCGCSTGSAATQTVPVTVTVKSPEANVVLIPTDAKPSVAQRAYATAKSTANATVDKVQATTKSAYSTVKSGAKSVKNSVESTAKSAYAGAKSMVNRTTAATSAALASAYTLTWEKHRLLTCSAAGVAAVVLLYNYNDSFRAQVRDLFGLDDATCRFCPEACDTDCSLN